MEPAAEDGSYLSADPGWLEACKAIGDDLDAIVAQNVAAYDTLGGQRERNRKRGTISVDLVCLARASENTRLPSFVIFLLLFTA